MFYWRRNGDFEDGVCIVAFSRLVCSLLIGRKGNGESLIAAMTSLQVKQRSKVEVYYMESNAAFFIGPKVRDLKAFLCSNLQIDAQNLLIHTAISSTPINCPDDIDICTVIASDETVLVGEHSPRLHYSAALSIEFHNGEPVLMEFSDAVLQCFAMPANDSCLFASVDFVTSDGKADLSKSSDLRYTIAVYVTDNHQCYNEAVLGMPIAQYCDWITNDEPMGGAVELEILCKLFELEIAVINMESGRLCHFGKFLGFEKIAILIYNNSHYQAVGLRPADEHLPVQTIFSIHSQGLLDVATRISLRFVTVNLSHLTRRYICKSCGHESESHQDFIDHATSSAHYTYE